jgi:hypothetical protein
LGALITVSVSSSTTDDEGSTASTLLTASGGTGSGGGAGAARTRSLNRNAIPAAKPVISPAPAATIPAEMTGSTQRPVALPVLLLTA